MLALSDENHNRFNVVIEARSSISSPKFAYSTRNHKITQPSLPNFNHFQRYGRKWGWVTSQREREREWVRE